MVYSWRRGGGTTHLEGEKIPMPHGARHYLPAYALSYFFFVISGCSSSSVGDSALQITPVAALVLPSQTVQFTAVTEVPDPPERFSWQVRGILGGSSAF